MIFYIKILNGLKKNGIDLDRKTLADMAQNEQDGFKQLVEKVKSSLN